MNKSTVVVALSTVVLTLGASAAFAADTKKTDPSMPHDMSTERSADQDALDSGFDGLDANADGYITPEEAADHVELSSDWEKADADADGRVSEAEFSAFEEKDD